MGDFLLSFSPGERLNGTGEPSAEDTVRYGDCRLTHDGHGFEAFTERGIYISGYLLPWNNQFTTFQGYEGHALVNELYIRYGRSFTGHVKGCFLVVIMSEGATEIFVDHLGLSRAFYHSAGGRFLLSGSVDRLRAAGAGMTPDGTSLAMQALFHRVPSRYTVFRDVFKTTHADYFRLEGGKVHHDHYFSPAELIKDERRHEDIPVEQFAGLLRDNTVNFNRYLRPLSTLITLTGGKDSRTLLAALLGAGINPVGLTYGSSRSRDAVYAAMVAAATGTKHIIIDPPVSPGWFAEEARAIIEGGDPEINIHRSHRHYAFESVPAPGRQTAYLAGYMGGELLMGIYYDDLIFTNFIKEIWSGAEAGQAAEGRLGGYFVRSGPYVTESVLNRIDEMACTDRDLSPGMREFMGLFEIGVPHHSQDIALASRYWDFPYPAFLDIEFLMLLFRSRHSFLFKESGTMNPAKRHGLFELNMKVQHLLYPALDKVPFGKRGYYSNSEYLRGPLYWSLVKGWRYFTDRRKYPPSFIYGREYRDFLMGILKQARSGNSAAGEYYRVDDAITGLEKLGFPVTERELHKYSDIVTFQMIFADQG
jgi:hypothetical protein